MNGHWVSGTRKLNHHYQSAMPSILRTYLYINDNRRNVNYRFTENGLVISGVRSTRVFLKMNDVTLTDDYIPVMVLYQFGISADGVGFKTLDLENETFVPSRNIDVIMRRETITLESKVDGSELEVDVIVFLVNRSEFGTYTATSGDLYFDSTTFSGLTFTFPNILTKIFEVERKFDLIVSGEFYYQPSCDTTYYYDNPNEVVPKNLSSLKKGSYNFMRSYKVTKEEWEKLYPVSSNDIYYGMKYSIRGDYPFTSVSPNMYGGRLGNYCMFLNGYATSIFYSNKSSRTYTQCNGIMPFYPILKNTAAGNFLVAQGLSPQSYSLHGRFFTATGGEDNTFRGLFTKASGTDWEVGLTNTPYICGLLDYVDFPSYGNPDDLSGSSMSVSNFTDMWINDFDSNA